MPKTGIGGADDQRQSLLEQMKTQMEAIRNDWSSGERLSSAFATEGEPPPEEQAQTLARQVLSFLRTRDELRQQVRERIRKVFDDARRGIGVLGATVLQGTEARPFGNVIYPVEFDSSPLAELVATLADTWSITTDNARRLLETAEKHTSSDYELFLALAIGLGAIGRVDDSLHCSSA